MKGPKRQRYYQITEVLTYSVKARSPKDAERKLLKHARAFHDDDRALADGVEFVEVSEREVELTEGGA